MLLITKPRTKEEIDELAWQLRYDTIRVFIREHRWYLMTEGRCIYLTSENLCSIYERRPSICRRHNPPECERYGKFYDAMIETPEALVRHLGEAPSRKKHARKAPRRAS